MPVSVKLVGLVEGLDFDVTLHSVAGRAGRRRTVSESEASMFAAKEAPNLADLAAR